MPRLFLTSREMNLISDITKELYNDVNGQTIKYYPISERRTHTGLYGEAKNKVFDNPIEIEAMVGVPVVGVNSTGFGSETTYTVEVMVHSRALIDKAIVIATGDFFSYGKVVYEIVSVTDLRPIAGQAEHLDGYKITAIQSRAGQFAVPKVYGPTDMVSTDPDALQTTFVQQRGEPSNRLGETGDVRELRRNGTLDEPISPPKEVSPQGERPLGKPGGSFYGDDDQ